MSDVPPRPAALQAALDPPPAAPALGPVTVYPEIQKIELEVVKRELQCRIKHRGSTDEIVFTIHHLDDTSPLYARICGFLKKHGPFEINGGFSLTISEDVAHAFLALEAVIFSRIEKILEDKGEHPELLAHMRESKVVSRVWNDVILHFTINSMTQIKLVNSEKVLRGPAVVAKSDFPCAAKLDVRFDHVYVRRHEGRWEMGIVFETARLREEALTEDAGW